MLESLIIGGGFFGLYLAEHFARRGHETLVCERGPALMERASYNNQARVHNGYHYPRSFLTARRSHANYARFVEEFSPCLDRSFEQVYAISSLLSKVTASQFSSYMRIVGSPIERASREIRSYFDPRFVEDVFLTEECAFDSTRLRDHMRARVEEAGGQIRCRTAVDRLSPCDGGDIVVTLAPEAGEPEEVRVRRVFNCTYSGINHVTHASGIDIIPLKHEMTEMCLIRVPEPLRHIGVTMMCGPFFSCMPFPPRGLHTLSHVRYTPHYHWFDSAHEYRGVSSTVDRTAEPTSFPYMIRDARKFLPILADSEYVDSLWEVKTILPRNEVDDGRPILYKPNHGIANHHVVMGGKLDNVYDAVREIDRTLGAAA